MSFTEIRCACKEAHCRKHPAIATGVVEGTVTIGIREHNRTIARVYLTYDVARVLGKELMDWPEPTGEVAE